MFLNLVMLAGLGGAAIPLVLHLLARARHRTVDWGAMMFLADLDPRHGRSSRLKQWTLLGVRMLLISVVAIALARPVVSRWGAAAAAGRTTAVILLDHSASLGYEEAGRSRFDRAREAAIQVLAGLRRTDQVSLVLLGDRVEVRHPEPTADLQGVAREVAELQVSAGAAELSRGLDAARRILDHPARLDRELYLITDRQAANWEQPFPAEFPNWVRDPRHPTRFHVIPVGGGQSDNLSVESVELAQGAAIRGQGNDVLVRVRNHSDEPQAGVELKISVLPPTDAGRYTGEFGQRPTLASVTVGPRQTTTVRVAGVVFQQSGPNLLTAELRSPGLESDNRAHLAVDVIPPIPTLIVSGDERAEEVRRESYFLRLALSPFQTAGRKGDPAAVTVIGPESLATAPLNDYAVIILANVPQLTPDVARALEQRVYEGAGLIICPGGLTRVENYNALLYRDGGGLLPARLSPPTGGDGSRATSILGMALDHAVFRFRRGGDPLPAAVIGRYFPAIARHADAAILAEYATGEPMLVEGPRGRGKVLLLTTPLDADWNTLPLSPFYLPFVQSLVRHAHPAPQVRRNLSPGERLAASFPEPPEDVLLNEKSVRDVLGGGGSQLRYDQTHSPGVYRLAYRTRTDRARDDHAWRVSYYVVRPDPRESDLTPMTPDQWERQEQALGFKLVDAGAGGAGLSRLLADQRTGRELWLALLLAALGLALGEVALARYWTEGAA